MSDFYINEYFLDCAHTALVDAENYAAQGRRARCQDSLLTAQYFSAKCDPTKLVEDFEERCRKLYKG